MVLAKIVAFSSLVFLGACCGPSTCEYARVSIDTLAPVTTRLIEYQAINGTAPKTLEDAFPKGLPGRLRHFSTKHTPSNVWISYYTFETSDSDGYAFKYTDKPLISFKYYDNLRGNACRWSTPPVGWQCGPNM